MARRRSQRDMGEVGGERWEVRSAFGGPEGRLEAGSWKLEAREGRS
jgi:hypothetical protein